MTAKELNEAVRTCALLGGALWGFAAVWLLTVVFSGFVTWRYASVYIALFLIVVGLAGNVILFMRAATLGRRALITLTGLSLSLSTLVVANIVYMAASR